MPVTSARDPSPGVEALALRTEEFDRFSHGLVRLEPHPLSELRRRVGEFARAVEAHLDAGGPGRPLAATAGRDRLAAEHLRFHSSVRELRSLLEVVEHDDHGGHRQALGQYGRLLAEALRNHLQDELRPPVEPPVPRAGTAGQR